MHEFAICSGLLRQVQSLAEEHGARRVVSVKLAIGALSGVETEAMRFCFDAVTRGSVADGAALEIVAVPGTSWCMQCGVSVEVAERYDPCPRCGGYQLQVQGGTEMRVKELEVE